MKNKVSSELPLHLLIMPSFLIVLIYSYGPMLGIVMAFQKYIPARGFLNSEWVGLKNFEYMLSLPDAMQAFWNTIYIAILKIIAGLSVPLVTALLLNEIRKQAFKRSVQTLIYLPHFLSWIILGGILIDILSPSTGIVNQFLSWLGITPIFFLGDNNWFRATLVVTDQWKEFGFGTIIYLAALTGVNPTLYEASAIDGANRLRQTWHVTLPGLRPIIVLMATLSLGQILNAGFEQVYNLSSPQVYQTGEIIDTMVYNMGLKEAQYSLATTLGLLKSVISFIFISIAYYLANRLANYRIF